MSEEKGWVAIWRKTRKNPLWVRMTMAQRSVFLTLLLLAEWKPRDIIANGEEMKLKPGQIFISVRKLVKECGVDATYQKTRTALELFEKFGFLTQEATHEGTLITLINWAKYQGEDCEAAQERARGQRKGNASLTQGQRNAYILRASYEPKETRETGETERVRARAQAHFTPPTLEEVQAYIDEKGMTFSASRFIDHYEGNGWMRGKSHIKDWKAVCRTWQANEKKASPQTPQDAGKARYEAFMKAMGEGK